MLTVYIHNRVIIIITSSRVVVIMEFKSTDEHKNCSIIICTSY